VELFAKAFSASTREEEYNRQISHLLDELKEIKQREERDQFDEPINFGNEAKPRKARRKASNLPLFKSSVLIDRDEKKINLTKLRNSNIMQMISATNVRHPGEDSDVPYISEMGI
jgi:hypothetical protein